MAYKDKELRFGVIGAGRRAPMAWLAHKPEEGTRLVGVADPRDVALDTFREKFGEDFFYTNDYKELLDRDDIDAVFVMSPDHLHFQHAIDSLKAGKDIYLEKPMSITIEDCDDILTTALTLNRKIYVGHNMRHMPFVLKMKEIIDKGIIGEVKAGWCRHFVGYGGDAYFKDWHAERSKSMGLLLQKGAHDIDILHWLCGGFTQRVVAMGQLSLYDKISDRHDCDDYGDAQFNNENWPPMSQKQLNPVIDVEDISQVMMELDNGVLTSYQQCHYTPDAWRNYTIIGTQGRIENFGDYDTDAVIKVWNKRAEYKADADFTFHMDKETGTHGGADIRIINDFISYLRTGQCKSCFAVEARNSVATGYLATVSLRNGSKPMEIPTLSDSLVEYFSNCAKEPKMV